MHNCSKDPACRRLYRGLLATLIVALTVGPLQAQPGRPIIVMIHGRDQAYEITSQLSDTWRNALVDGIGKLRLGATIDPAQDVRFVSYQDIYEPGYEKVGCAQYGTLSAESADQTNAANAGTSDFLTWLSREGAKLGFTSTVMSFLGDTKLYLDDADIRCDTDDRLVSAINDARREKRPVILLSSQ